MAFYRTKTRLEPEKDGFHGVYWENKRAVTAAMIVMLGDDTEDAMAKGGAKWLSSLGLNIMTMSPAKKDYGHHNYPLERIERAIEWMRARGNVKFGVAGASTTGMLALAAASYFPDLTLTLAFTPSDFVWEGFMQGNKDGCREWPVDGESTLSYRGEPLPYMPFIYRHPQYWQTIRAESKATKNMIASRKIFDDSEKAGLIPENAFIKVENIKGKLLLAGAEDDALWDTVRYIRRIEARLQERPHECGCEALIYEHGTHFIFPQSMMETILPVGSGLFVKYAFSAAKRYPRECRETREDIDKKVRAAVDEWL